MQIVIDIPEEYRSIFEENSCKEKFDSLATNEFGYVLRKAFEKGTPIPKGCGRLIDADALNRKDVNCANVPMNFIDTAPAIIERDNS